MFIKVGQWPIKSVKLRFGEKKGLCEAGPGSQWVHAAGPVRESQEPIPAPQRPGLEWASQGLLLTQQTLWGESCACTRGRGVGAGGQAGVGTGVIPPALQPPASGSQPQQCGLQYTRDPRCKEGWFLVSRDSEAGF